MLLSFLKDFNIKNNKNKHNEYMGGIIKLCAFLFLIFSQVGFSQSISLQDGFITPAPLGTVENLGQGVASFRIQEMSGTDIAASVFGGQPNVKVVLDLGDYITLNGVIGDITGTSNGVNVVSLFDIEFNTTDNIITFRQKKVIPADFLGEISFPVKVTQNSSRAESLNGFNANISALGTDTHAVGNTSFFTYTSESSLEVIKSVVNVPSEFSVGTVINYEIEVTNSGDEVISNIEITDPGATITSGNPITSLFPGKSSVVSASYTLTQADIDKGSYRNTARAVGDSLGGEDNVMAISDAGTDVNGNEIVDPLNVDGPDSDTDTTNDPTDLDLSKDQNPAMTLIKSITSNGPYTVGSNLTYELVVTNTGMVTLSNIEVTDPGATITSGNPIASLAPGESVVVEASYALSQEDVDKGSYSNSATVTGDSTTGVDDVIVVSDAGTDENGNEIIDPLNVDGPDADNDSTNDATIINITNESVSSMTLIKSISSSGPYVSGSTITYDLVVTNTGTVTLSNIEVEDPGATIISGNPIAILAPGDSVVVTAAYTITQADLDSGKYSNSATATGDSTTGVDDVTVISDAGTDENGNEIEDPLEVDGPDADNDPTNDATVLNLGGAMTLIKSVTSTGPYSLGDTLTYELVVTNTGNVVLSNIEVIDDGATITSGNPIANLAPGESLVVTAMYVITQLDVDNGSYSNSATAIGDSTNGTDDITVISDAGTDEQGNVIPDPLKVDGPDADTDPTNDATIIDLSSNGGVNDSSMTLIKSVTSVGPYGVGSLIKYELVVTNTGETVLSNIEIEDPGATIISGNPIANLAPGASATVKAQYAVNEINIYNGSYSNSATATGDSPEGIDDVTVVSDAGTDEFGEIIEDPLTEESDINPDGDPTNDVTHLILDSCIKIYNEFSPNGDGVNEYFKIKCIRDYPENTVEIFNRWGNLVFSVEGYNNSTILFAGKSKGRVNVRVDEELPTGTYFYMIDLGNGSDVLKGWLYLNR